MIALDKKTGFRPVGVGENWRRLMAKCVLRVTGQEAKAACGTEQLEGGAEVGIEGGYMICACYGNITPSRRTVGFSSLIRGTHSTRRTRRP